MDYEPVYRQTKKLELFAKEAWAEWLQTFPWTHFLTVTYRLPRRARSDGGDISRVLKVVRRTLPTARVFLAGEAHSSGDLHVHGIFSATHLSHPEWAATQIWGDCFRYFGRSEVQRVRSSDDVADYCSKYVTKQMANYLMD